MGEPALTDGWHLDRYREGDETAILELFAAVFGKSRSLAHWTWQFKRNPYAGPFVTIARRNTDSAPIGIYSVMPMKLSLMGKPVLICQSVDTAVHASYRGQRIFERTARDCYAWCTGEGVQAVVGFPNANSYPGFVRNLGWRRIALPTSHVMRASVEDGLRTILRAPLLPRLLDVPYRAATRIRLSGQRALLERQVRDVAFGVSATVPDGYAQLWDAWRSDEVLCVWKDTEYLRWRYDENPDHRFQYLYLTSGDRMIALAIGVEIDRGMVLCEFLVEGRDVRVGRRLAVEIARDAVRRGMREVSFVGHDVGFYQDVFRGFRHQKAYSRGFCGLAFHDGPLKELLPHADNWTVTFGDSDLV